MPNNSNVNSNCNASLPAAPIVKSIQMRKILQEIQKFLFSTRELEDSIGVSYVKRLLRGISSNAEFIKSICFNIFLQLLSNLEENEEGSTVYGMIVLIDINSSFSSFVGANGMKIVHHLASSFHFSFFMSRAAESSDGLETNPFEILLHKVIAANPDALFAENAEGECPIHLHIRSALYRPHFLSVLLKYSPKCAARPSKLFPGKYPIHILISQLDLNQDDHVDFNGYPTQCFKVVLEAFPTACFMEVTDTITRLQLNSHVQRSHPVTSTWSPYSLVTQADNEVLAKMMLASNERHALNSLRTVLRRWYD